MRQIITVADIRSLVGKFVIQLNAKDENVDIIHQGNDGFWMEKRIAFVGIIDIIGEGKLKNRFQKQKNPTVILNGLYFRSYLVAMVGLRSIFHRGNRALTCFSIIFRINDKVKSVDTASHFLPDTTFFRAGLFPCLCLDALQTHVLIHLVGGNCDDPHGSYRIGVLSR